jgi:hypothetical protein
MAPVAGVYLGLVTALVGLIGIAHPLPVIGVTSRLRGALVLVVGLLLVAVGWSLPAPERRVVTRRTRLDDFVPVYQFNEVHTRRIDAAPDRVYAALRAVTAHEIRFFRALTWIRRFGRPGPESILHAPERQPILDVAMRTTFLLLAEEPGRELVVGTIVLAPRDGDNCCPTPEAFAALARPGFAKAAMNFRVAPDGRGGSLVTTETRVFATDIAARRRFARYWRLIYPGSALIRREWLRAIDRRARAP